MLGGDLWWEFEGRGKALLILESTRQNIRSAGARRTLPQTVPSTDDHLPKDFFISNYDDVSCRRLQPQKRQLQLLQHQQRPQLSQPVAILRCSAASFC